MEFQLRYILYFAFLFFTAVLVGRVIYKSFDLSGFNFALTALVSFIIMFFFFFFMMGGFR